MTTELEIRCRSQPVVFELSVLWPDDHAKGPLAGHQAMPPVPGTHQHDGRAVQLPAARGYALRHRLAPQRRRHPAPQATGRVSMRNAMAIAAVQRALGGSRGGSGATASNQRRAAEDGIELRRARVFTLASKRLTASLSRWPSTNKRPHPSMAALASVPPAPPEAGGRVARRQGTMPGKTPTHPPPARTAR